VLLGVSYGLWMLMLICMDMMWFMMVDDVWSITIKNGHFTKENWDLTIEKSRFKHRPLRFNHQNHHKIWDFNHPNRDFAIQNMDLAIKYGDFMSEEKGASRQMSGM
jgi:hypothetical protein